MSEPAAASRPGTLKIYLGYAAGVGKTYKMLTEVRQLRQEGADTADSVTRHFRFAAIRVEDPEARVVLPGAGCREHQESVRSDSPVAIQYGPRESSEWAGKALPRNDQEIVAEAVIFRKRNASRHGSWSQSV